MKKYFMMLLTASLLAAPSSLAAAADAIRSADIAVSSDAVVSADAARSPDASLSDARMMLDVLSRARTLVTPKEFADAFGRPTETRNLGADAYRNHIWSFELASADVPMTLHAGFNYGELADLSMTIDFGDDIVSERRYFVTLCRGLERATSHVSPVTRFQPVNADHSVNAYYPLDGSRPRRVMELSSTDTDSFARITMMPVLPELAHYVTVRVLSGDARMRRYPDATAELIRTLIAGHFAVAQTTRDVETSVKGGSVVTRWMRLFDKDGKLGWVLAAEVSPVGVYDLDHAFDRF